MRNHLILVATAAALVVVVAGLEIRALPSRASAGVAEMLDAFAVVFRKGMIAMVALGVIAGYALLSSVLMQVARRSERPLRRAHAISMSILVIVLVALHYGSRTR